MALENQLDGLQKRLGLPFAHEAKLAQITGLRSELQALLQSDTPIRGNLHDNTGEDGKIDQAAATATLEKEAVQERTAAIVRAFDALMKDSPTQGTVSTETLSLPQQPQAVPASRPWIEKIEPTTPTSLRERYAVTY